MFDHEFKDPAELQKLAYELATQDYDLVFALVKIRIEKNLDPNSVAESIGMSLEALREFENNWSDPRLSTIRRYALAVGANYTHTIQALDGEQDV